MRRGRGSRIIWYGLPTNADLRAENIALRLRRACTSMWSIKGRGKPIESPLVGRINVSNILAAVGAGLSYGMDLATIARGHRRCAAPSRPLRTRRRRASRFWWWSTTRTPTTRCAT